MNPVNCVGVAGRGLAREFRERYAKNHLTYRDACLRGEVQAWAGAGP